MKKSSNVTLQPFVKYRKCVCTLLPSLGVCKKQKRNTFLLVLNAKTRFCIPVEQLELAPLQCPDHASLGRCKQLSQITHPKLLITRVYFTGPSCSVFGVTLFPLFLSRYEDGTEFLPMEADVCDEETEAYVTNLSYYHLVPFETDILE